MPEPDRLGRPATMIQSCSSVTFADSEDMRRRAGLSRIVAPLPAPRRCRGGVGIGGGARRGPKFSPAGHQAVAGERKRLELHFHIMAFATKPIFFFWGPFLHQANQPRGRCRRARGSSACGGGTTAGGGGFFSLTVPSTGATRAAVSSLSAAPW